MIYVPHALLKKGGGVNMDYIITKKHAKNLTEGRIRAIQDAPPPDYPEDINNKDCWIKLEITQHNPSGERKDVIMAYMAHDRIDSFNVKDGLLMIIKENGKGLLKMGTHRLMAWIARNKLTSYGNV
jgi:hypothetical protein